MNIQGKKDQCPSKIKHSKTPSTVLHHTSRIINKKNLQNSDLKDSASVSVSTAKEIILLTKQF